MKRRQVRRRIPRRKRTFRRKIKRSHRSRRRLRVKTNRIRGVNYQGDRTIVTFQYINEQQFLNAGGANGVTLTLPGNYLPGTDIPSLGPYLNQYSQARIKSSSLSVTFENANVASLGGAVAGVTKCVGVYPMGLNIVTIPTPSSTVYLSEQPRCKYTYITPISGSRSRARITHRSSTAQAFGDRTPTTSGQDVLNTNLMTTPPTEQWNWAVFTQNNINQPTETIALGGTNLLIRLRYTIEFYERKTLTV